MIYNKVTKNNVHELIANEQLNVHVQYPRQKTMSEYKHEMYWRWADRMEQLQRDHSELNSIGYLDEDGDFNGLRIMLKSLMNEWLDMNYNTPEIMELSGWMEREFINNIGVKGKKENWREGWIFDCPDSYHVFQELITHIDKLKRELTYTQNIGIDVDGHQQVGTHFKSKDSAILNIDRVKELIADIGNSLVFIAYYFGLFKVKQS